MLEPIFTRTAEQDFFNKGILAELHFWYKGNVLVHSHDYYEIVIITKGRMNHILNGKSRIMTEKMFVIMKPGDSHEFYPYNNEQNENMNISIEKNTFLALYNSMFTLVADDGYPIFENQYYLLSNKVYDYVLYLADIVNTYSIKKSLHIIKTLIMNLLMDITDPSSEMEKSAPEWLINFIQQLSVPENFTKPISELYKMVHINRIALEKAFKEYTNKTIVSYVSEKKISYACGLLENTNYSIEYISALISYYSPAHFCRTFKNQKGITPLQYRKLHIRS